jgi:hypothetical protein
VFFTTSCFASILIGVTITKIQKVMEQPKKIIKNSEINSTQTTSILYNSAFELIQQLSKNIDDQQVYRYLRSIHEPKKAKKARLLMQFLQKYDGKKPLNVLLKKYLELLQISTKINHTNKQREIRYFYETVSGIEGLKVDPIENLPKPDKITKKIEPTGHNKQIVSKNIKNYISEKLLKIDERDHNIEKFAQWLFAGHDKGENNPITKNLKALYSRKRGAFLGLEDLYHRLRFDLKEKGDFESIKHLQHLMLTFLQTTNEKLELTQEKTIRKEDILPTLDGYLVDFQNYVLVNKDQDERNLIYNNLLGLSHSKKPMAEIYDNYYDFLSRRGKDQELKDLNTAMVEYVNWKNNKTLK